MPQVQQYLRLHSIAGRFRNHGPVSVPIVFTLGGKKTFSMCQKTPEPEKDGYTALHGNKGLMRGRTTPNKVKRQMNWGEKGLMSEKEQISLNERL